jgi:D-glycero-alpha-D-manno-heptose-7-phosphate kinase
MNYKKNIDKYIIKNSSTIGDALNAIDNNKSGFIIIVDNELKVKGVLTDGDVRRLIIKKINLNENAYEFSNKEFIKVNLKIKRENILKIFDEKIKFVPVVDDNDPENKTIIRSKSPVRISFGGGGSDTTTYFKLSKGAVINATISVFTHCSLKIRPDSKISIDSLDLNSKVDFKNISELNSYQGPFSLITSTISTINPKFGLDLYLHSDYPISSGLGGSAVVVTSILGCFNELRNDKWTNHEISEIAYQIERLRLGVDGGWQDQYATAFGGINHMEFEKEKNFIYPLRLNRNVISELEESLVLCYTGMKHDSGNIHTDQKKKTKDLKTKEKIKNNVELTQRIKYYMMRGEVHKIGKCLHESWNLKRTFSKKISNEKIDKIYNKALKNGATGGKLLGAGGGGFFLFFAPYYDKHKLLKWIKSENLEHTPFVFENKGLRSWKVRVNQN